MNFRFTIGKKIASGFGILIILTMIVFITTYDTLERSRTTSDRISSVNTPSVKALQELKFSILETKVFLETWLKENKAHQDKDNLIKFRKEDYPKLKYELTQLGVYWGQVQQDTLQALFSEIDLLFTQQNDDLINNLQSFSDYEDGTSKFIGKYSLEEGGEIHTMTSNILDHLSSLITNQKQVSNTANDSMYKLFDFLKNLVIGLGIALIVISVIVAIITTKNIVDPIYRLKNVLVKLGRGVFPDMPTSAGNDEIGEMSVAMNNVVDGLKRTKDFAQEVGSGNFDTDYKPLSSKDSLGKALLKMRDDLAENERFLEEKVRQRTAEVVKQKEEIDIQKEQIEEYFIEVTDSIKYAQKIQEAILPPESYVRKLLPDSFIFYKPKDMVSGDFYWLGASEDEVYFAAVDCTGHGVPGAFMSIIGYNQLKQALITTNNGTPAEILDHLNVGVSETLHQKDENSTSKDGMDVAICCLNHKTKELQYAGAFNPLYLLRGGDIIQTKGDKFPIGSFLDGETPNFTNNIIQLLEGDILYIFSDGYADQFGGPKGKKMMYKKFRDTLIANSHKDLSVQKDLLRDHLSDWMGDEEQVDDIIVIGVKV
ncbi:MAG: serine phosphatase RsbU (regulator of sigma subunit) [Vicingaceae bacterium]|jgi:serine phosphatase RsbU (regulator of sigma subunit)